MTKKLVIIFVILLTVAAITSCGSKDSEGGQTRKAAPQTGIDGSPASGPVIQFVAQDPQGIPQSSSLWIGKRPVVLNFWGTWCPPCRREIPDLVRLYEEYQPRGVEMIGVAVKDEPRDVSAYAIKAGMKWVMLMANDDVLQAYDIVNGVPTTVFLDKDGRELTRFVGSRSYDDFKPAFEAILQGYTQSE